MAISTVDFYVKATDGWTLVATSPTALTVKPSEFHPWYVALTASGAPATGTQATGTLTLAGNAIADETVTVGATVFTWKASAASSTEVTIGASASDSIDALIAKINAHPTASLVVTASAGSGDTMVVTASATGTAGTGVVTTETMTDGSWGSGATAGGVNAVEGLGMSKDDNNRFESFETGAVTGNVYIRVKRDKNGDSRGYHFGVIRDQ